ncbi:MAG: hypothetical protein VR70_05345 [Rhodospirillaceae bacterium BRH_c57]|nr:MAG: hypothetical protein VR70_05345 [Rhodospirillaceae bacterium BRH_c57]
MVWDKARWPNFSPGELWCKGTGKMQFHPGFLDALQALRAEYGQGMTITSACRSADYNSKVGGARRSLHICDVAQHSGQAGTLAVDVAVGGAAHAHGLVSLALSLGWSVGVPNLSRGFVHLDRRDLVGLPCGVFGY